ncbi:Eco57I restriction-modification methylase domain-containing protein [Patescibacteria group bacterium]|nr:Eco57I restriction-modification methylase domain-containing protein [Patescibacteria group bacterium]
MSIPVNLTISQLVKKYEENRNAYLNPTYKEAQLRIDFLDPLFELLGWDIKNQTGKSTNEREVLVEESLREDVCSVIEKPDYTFRLFSERKFYLEAKKPSVKINTDNEPAKQVRRYGFTSKLKISALSNFEYLAIYDCSQKIEEGDKVSNSRVKLYHYTEYETVFEEIKKELGRDSIYSGEFDITWEYIEERLRLFSVNDLFLSQINDWRLILGKEIFLHKSTLTEPELNDLVQRYINSIIFLRVCEDRNLEAYKTLLSSNGDYEALIKLFRAADKKYNAGLFNHPFNEEVIKSNSSAFWTIISQLYYPESTYSFAVFSSDILGNIYEIFLGQKLSINADGEISLAKKPEHIDRDIVATPTFIIKDLLRKTALPFSEGKTDKEILSSSFADIACGSGAFLLETYQLIIDFLVDYYLENSPETLIQTGVNSYKLPFKLKREVLVNCLHGIDKDYNAVEACKFGLLLKLLEDENSGTISTPALPLLNKNIQFGNSLIDSTKTSKENQKEINPFDFKDAKFNVIVGNPPYMSTEHMKQLIPLELPIYKKVYESSYKQFDKYFLFIERGLSLLVDDGYLGYIVPSKFIKVGAGKKLRGLLKEEQSVEEVISFGANQVFQNKTTYTCLLVLKKTPQSLLKYLEIKNLSDWKTRSIQPRDYDTVDYNELDNDVWILVPGYLKPAYLSINEQSISLEELVGSGSIYNGIQTSANNIYIHTASKEDENYVYFTKDGKSWRVEKILTRPYFQTSSGNDNLNSYRLFKPNSFVIYPYLKTDTGIEFVKIDKLKSEFTYMYKYLMKHKDKLKKRDIKPIPKTPDEWYRYGRHQGLEKCEVPIKIVVGINSIGNKYAIDYHQTLISSGGTAGYGIITLPDDCPYSVYYIQALLNSKYLELYASLIGEVFRGGYIARGTKVLKKLPIRIINFSDTDEKNQHDKIASLQEELISIQGKIDLNSGNNRALEPLKREFDTKKQELNRELIALYELGDIDEQIPLIAKIYEAN